MGYVYGYDGLRLRLRWATSTATLGYVYSYGGLRL
jgi:hypothetical protein